MQARNFLKSLFPGLIGPYRRARVNLLRRRFHGKSVMETFTEIYRTNGWGVSEDGTFCSGHGSRNEFATRYAQLVNDLILSQRITSILDIGCGDYKVAEQFSFGAETSYVGMDVVPDLIEHHQRVHARSNVNFVCANAIDDALPDADLCLIRQVLQHLSNEQIAKILAKCRKYRYLIITEDVYTGLDVRRNVDVPHGLTTRWYLKSGVFVNAPPFDLQAKTVLEIPMGENAALRTVLVEAA